VQFLLNKFATRIGKRIRTVTPQTMHRLCEYEWPGNVRELENLIERAVIVSPGTVLRVPVGELKPPADPAAGDALTLEAFEREHILRALEATNWVLAGPRGAAARLGMKRTTLQSRMQKLGVSRNH